MLELLESLPTSHKLSFNNIDKKRMRKRIAMNKKKTRIIRDNDKPNESVSCKNAPLPATPILTLIPLLVQQEESDKRSEANPTTKLLEYQKKRHGKEPAYVLVEEKGRGRKKQFSIEVSFGN